MATYKAKETYVVKLSHIVRHGPMAFRPSGEIEMTGAFLNTLVEAHGQEIVDYARPKS